MKKYTGRIVMLGSIMTALFITLFLVLKSLPYNPYPFENLDAEVTLPESIDVPEFIKNVYVHGTNSEKRLREYEKFYENFELDVYVGDGVLDIFHYPEHSTIHFDIDNFFKVKTYKTGKFWLDIKNLKYDNVDVVDGVLKRIVSDYRSLSKEDFIIESKNPKAIGSISLLGYKASYYLPSDIENFRCDSKEVLNVISNIKEFNITMISYPQRQEHIVSECIMGASLLLDRMSWGWSVSDISKSIDEVFFAYTANHVVKKNDVKLSDKILNKVNWLLNVLEYNFVY